MLSLVALRNIKGQTSEYLNMPGSTDHKVNCIDRDEKALNSSHDSTVHNFHRFPSSVSGGSTTSRGDEQVAESNALKRFGKRSSTAISATSMAC